MGADKRTPVGAESDLTPDAAAAAIRIGWQAASTALALIGRGDFVASLSAAQAAIKAMEAAGDTLAFLARTHG